VVGIHRLSRALVYGPIEYQGWHSPICTSSQGISHIEPDRILPFHPGDATYYAGGSVEHRLRSGCNGPDYRLPSQATNCLAPGPFRPWRLWGCIMDPDRGYGVQFLTTRAIDQLRRNCSTRRKSRTTTHELCRHCSSAHYLISRRALRLPSCMKCGSVTTRTSCYQWSLAGTTTIRTGTVARNILDKGSPSPVGK
jgi:hypothetical protein